MKYLIIIFSFFFIASCTKNEKYYKQEEKFQEMLDSLILMCPTETSEYFFKARINKFSTCYLDGNNGLGKTLSYTNSFTTQSPTTTGKKSNVGHNIFFGILPIINPTKYQNWIQFETPLFGVDVTKEQYLDSLFSIEYHKIMDRNCLTGINVSLKMFDKTLNYPISSKYGYHLENDYIRFIKSDKLIEGGNIYYDIEMEVQASLYYYKDKDGYTPYGKEGLWGRLENGLLKMKVKL